MSIRPIPGVSVAYYCDLCAHYSDDTVYDHCDGCDGVDMPYGYRGGEPDECGEPILPYRYCPVTYLSVWEELPE